MFAKTNVELVRAISLDIEDQLLIVASQLPESATESVRSEALLYALREIVQEIVEDRGLTPS